MSDEEVFLHVTDISNYSIAWFACGYIACGDAAIKRHEQCGCKGCRRAVRRQEAIERKEGTFRQKFEKAR